MQSGSRIEDLMLWPMIKRWRSSSSTRKAHDENDTMPPRVHSRNVERTETFNLASEFGYRATKLNADLLEGLGRSTARRLPTS